MLAALIIVAAAFASNAQNLIVSKTYYDTGLAFDGSQWTQNPQSGPMTFTVYEESLHMSDGSWAIRSGNATVYGFTERKYIFVGPMRWQDQPTTAKATTTNITTKHAATATEREVITDKPLH